MSTPRRRDLQIDDPLRTGQPTAPEAAASRRVEATDRRSEEGQQVEPESDRQDETVAPRHATARMPQPANREVWRAWSGITGVGSFRLPHELLVELGDTARELGLPIGMIVTAAITQLLDQPPEQIAEPSTERTTPGSTGADTPGDASPNGPRGDWHAPLRKPPICRRRQLRSRRGYPRRVADRWRPFISKSRPRTAATAGARHRRRGPLRATSP
jgi:hypothetical protein